MKVARVAVFALVIGLVGGYQVGRAEPRVGPPGVPAAPIAGAATTVARPTRVLLVGDSILRQTGPALASRLGEDFRVRNAAVNGSGLLTPQVVDWPRRLTTNLARTRPEVVVFAFIGNYTGDPDGLWMKEDGGRVDTIQSDTFGPEWGRETDAAMAAIGAVGAEVVLVLPPPMPVPALQMVVDTLRAEYEQVAERWPFVHLVDGNAALGGPGGAWSAATRAWDGVHLSEVGERLLADAVARVFAPA
jgi:hypothetical protein